MTYSDILYNETNGVARITINRAKVYNAFRGRDLRGDDRRFAAGRMGQEPSAWWS